MFQLHKKTDESDRSFNRGFEDGLYLVTDTLIALPQLSTYPCPGADYSEDRAAHWCAWLDAGDARSLAQVEAELERAPDEIRDPGHELFTTYRYWIGVAAGMEERRRQLGDHGKWQAAIEKKMLEMRDAGYSVSEIVEAVAAEGMK